MYQERVLGASASMVLCPLVALVLGKPGSNLTSLGGGHAASWCLPASFLGPDECF